MHVPKYPLCRHMRLHLQHNGRHCKPKTMVSSVVIRSSTNMFVHRYGNREEASCTCHTVNLVHECIKQRNQPHAHSWRMHITTMHRTGAQHVSHVSSVVQPRRVTRYCTQKGLLKIKPLTHPFWRKNCLTSYWIAKASRSKSQPVIVWQCTAAVTTRCLDSPNECTDKGQNLYSRSRSSQ
jgi:hypothetical protein